MRKALMFAALAWPLALPAAALQDWRAFQPGASAGTYADQAGSRVELALDEGPRKDEKAMRLKSDLVEWAGAWCVSAPLGKAGGLRFKARADRPLQLLVGLSDQSKVHVEATVRVLGSGWQEFELPLSAFRRSAWQDPAAPKGGVFNPDGLGSFSFAVLGKGASTLWIGPLDAVEGPVRLRDGQPATGPGRPLVVQDFVALDAGAYGPFSDPKGSTVAMEPRSGAPDSKDGWGARFDYDLKDGGWCGEWIRAGADWTGQDWSGGKTLLVKVHSLEPLALELAFNDANQNAYLAPAATTRGRGWETLSMPLAGLRLNPDYQPPKARPGAPLDLSRIETFNLSPKTPGRHVFWVESVSLGRR